jgi:hypothetical protein
MPLKFRSPDDCVSMERLKSLMEYNKDTGEFTWLVRRNCHAGGIRPGMIVRGTIDGHGYRQIGIDGVRYLNSRLAWFYVHGYWPNCEIDHKDANPLNNALDNLRLATGRDLNRANQKVRKDSKSGIKGVNFDSRQGGWRARCKQKTLGVFPTKELAAAAYAKAAYKEFGEFARLA